MATIHPASALDLDYGGKFFQFKIKVDPTTYRELNQIIKGINNTQNVLNSYTTIGSGISALGQRMTMNHVGRGSLTTAWPPLSEYTLQVKEDRGYSGTRMMTQSGAMYR